ncbi:unnamed protein product, partial [Iphiclides podalirius]
MLRITPLKQSCDANLKVLLKLQVNNKRQRLDSGPWHFDLFRRHKYAPLRARGSRPKRASRMRSVASWSSSQRRVRRPWIIGSDVFHGINLLNPLRALDGIGEPDVCGCRHQFGR